MFTKEQADKIISIIELGTFIKVDDSDFHTITVKRTDDAGSHELEIEYIPTKKGATRYEIDYTFYEKETGDFCDKRSGMIILVPWDEQDARIISAIEARIRYGAVKVINREEERIKEEMEGGRREKIGAALDVFLDDEDDEATAQN